MSNTLSLHDALPIWWAVLSIASLVQTIPGLALLALFYPVLLGISRLTGPAFGFDVPALGFLPSLMALTLYAMLPILRNGITGMLGVDAAYLEAADGVGMTPRQKLFRVELPLAAPVMMAGVRTSAVWTIGMATLSTTVGQTSLGNFIFSGLQTENWIAVAVGCAAVVALALITDQILGVIETAAAGRHGGRMAAAVAALAVGVGLAGAPLWLGRGESFYVVGAKNFSEQFILAELMAKRLEGTGRAVERRQGLGSAVIFRALASGDIDCYVDYSGTLWANQLGRRDVPSRGEILDELTRDLMDRYGITVLGALGFENAYALAMKRDRAATLRINDIPALASAAPRLKLGSDLEFLARPEWAALKQVYGLAFAEEKSFSPTFMYQAVRDGNVDVISAFSSDGRIAADDLKVLPDVRNAVPAYDAVILISRKRRDDEAMRQALMPLVGAIAVERMREANLMIDRAADKASVPQAARFLAGHLKAPQN